MKRTYGNTKPLGATARSVEILRGSNVIAKVQANNLPDALRRWYLANLGSFTLPLVVGNTMTVRDTHGIDVTIVARDVPGVDFLRQEAG